MFLRVAEILWQNSFLVGKSWSSCKHDRFEKSSGQWKILIKRPHRDSTFGDFVYLKKCYHYLYTDRDQWDLPATLGTAHMGTQCVSWLI